MTFTRPTMSLSAHLAASEHDRPVAAMSGHTPGPWAISPHSGHVRSAGLIIATPCDPDYTESFAAWPANRKLIAASPDLLAALEHGLEKYDLDPELQHVFRAAIEKARKQ